MLRRGPDPLEMASVLQRLERLQVLQVAPPAGWLPPAPAEPAAEAGPPSAAVSPDTGPVVRTRAWLPASLRARALDPGRRGVAVLAALALCGAGGGAWYFVRAAPHARSTASSADATTDSAAVGADPAPAATQNTPGPTSAVDSAGPVGSTSVGPAVPIAAINSPAAAGGSGTVVVDVVGKVVRPGVFTLPVSSRIVDAIAAAGGTQPGTDLTALDLASKLIDGEEIFVGIPPPSGVAAQSGGGVVGDNTGAVAPIGTAATVVDLNTSTLAELETLPGVGAVTAQKILDWRAQHGRFTSVGQLQQVSGIGPSKYAGLVGRVKV
jgi:competence protein ComEA